MVLLSLKQYGTPSFEGDNLGDDMKVRVKEGKSYFYNGSLRNEGEEFILKKREHSVDKNDDGSPVIITIEQQFSEKCMEKVKAPGRPKKDD